VLLLNSGRLASTTARSTRSWSFAEHAIPTPRSSGRRLRNPDGLRCTASGPYGVPTLWAACNGVTYSCGRSRPGSRGTECPLCRGVNHDEVREAEVLMGACGLVRARRSNDVGRGRESSPLREEVGRRGTASRSRLCCRCSIQSQARRTCTATHHGAALPREQRGHLRFHLEKHRGTAYGGTCAAACLRFSRGMRGALFRGERGDVRETAEWLGSGKPCASMRGVNMAVRILAAPAVPLNRVDTATADSGGRSVAPDAAGDNRPPDPGGSLRVDSEGPGAATRWRVACAIVVRRRSAFPFAVCTSLDLTLALVSASGSPREAVLVAGQETQGRRGRGVSRFRGDRARPRALGVEGVVTVSALPSRGACGSCSNSARSRCACRRVQGRRLHHGYAFPLWPGWPVARARQKVSTRPRSSCTSDHLAPRSRSC